MNKDKLISLVIRKDTYKDTKPYLLDLLNLKDEAVKISAQAVKEILTTDYNAEAKLYAVRYLKDAFEKGNPAFIQHVESHLLNILVGIALDELDEKAVTKYAGSSFTKNEELVKFKSILSSLFRMTKECLIKWAEWIPDAGRKFTAALGELKRRNVQFEFEFKYFRQENEQLFREYCAKNGVKLTPAAVGKVEQKKEAMKDPLIAPVEQALKKVAVVKGKGELDAVEQEFNTALNEYLENSKDFKEEFLTKWFDQFERAKTAAVKTLKSGAESKTGKETKEEKSRPTPGEPEKSKIPKTKISDEKQAEIDNSKAKVSSSKTEKKEKTQKMDKVEPSAPTSPRGNKAPNQSHPSSKKVEPVTQSNTLNVKREEVLSSNPPAASTAPKSPKRPPLAFDQPQKPKPSPPTPPQKKPQPKPPQTRQIQKFDNSLSKITDRVNFSDSDSESQPSQQAFQLAKQSNLKKKSKLPAIEEQAKSIPNISGVKSPRTLQEGDVNVLKQKTGNVSSKLLQENKHLMERLEALLKELEREKQEKIELIRTNATLEKEMQVMKENEGKLTRKVKTSVPMEDYNKLRKDYEQEKEKREAAVGENNKLKEQYDSLIQELNETKHKLNDATIQAKEKERQKPKQILPYDTPNPSNLSQRPPDRPLLSKQQLDPDYLKNLTHPSNIHSWLNEINTTLFKKNILGLSEIFYRDDYATLLCKSSVYTQNHQQFLSVQLTLQFKSLKQVAPHLKYKNCQELDLWTKPLTGQQLLYRQQLAVKLHRNPLKLLKAELKIIENLTLTFLLPCMYLNFLREQEFSPQQFDDVFTSKSEQLIKSKIVQWNPQILKEPSDFKKLFKNACVEENRVKLCLSEGINDRIFMVQVELLRNTKFMLRILPIPYTEDMVVQAKELAENMVFLLS